LHVDVPSMAAGVGLGVGVMLLTRKFGSRAMHLVWHRDHQADHGDTERTYMFYPQDTPQTIPVMAEQPAASMLHTEQTSGPYTEPTSSSSTTTDIAPNASAESVGPETVDQYEKAIPNEGETVHWPDRPATAHAGSVQEPPRAELPRIEQTQPLTTVGSAAEVDDEEIETFVTQELRRTPTATYDDVLAAWHVRQGTVIGEREAARVAAIYANLSSAFRAA
jgi:hypothetical protein